MAGREAGSSEAGRTHPGKPWFGGPLGRAVQRVTSNRRFYWLEIFFSR